MNELATLDAYGALTEPATVKIQRRLPGPIERVWAYLTESELRRQWLAAGRDGDEGRRALRARLAQRRAFRFARSAAGRLSRGAAGCRAGSPSSIRRTSSPSPGQAAATSPSSWNRQGNEVLLTVIHRRLPDRDSLLKHAAGWHMHLDVLVARATGKEPEPFWDGWLRLKQEYDRRLPA